MRKYISGVNGLVVAYLKRFTRDKIALFFTFLFPLLFLFCFGAIFSGNTLSFKVALINNSDTEFAREFVKQAQKDDKTFKVQDNVKDMSAALEKMSRGEIDSILELPKGFGEINQSNAPSGEMNVYYQKGAEQSGKTVGAVMQNVLDDINRQMGRPDPALKVNQKSTDKTGLSTFDYTFSGLLGFSIMSMGIFGLATSMPQEKQKGAFRRLRASPFRSSQLVIANALYYLVLTILSVLTMIAVGIMVFKFNMRGDWITFGIFAVLAAVMILGFGLLIGSWARNENQAAPLSNLLAFPMMFLSGVFFPRFLYPEWLQNITSYVPLTPVVDGFRRIMTENASLLQLGPEIAIMGIWVIITYVGAAVLFRWE